jgi:hypothetical protein
LRDLAATEKMPKAAAAGCKLVEGDAVLLIF